MEGDTTDELWDFMHDYQGQHEFPPTMDEIVQGMTRLNYRSSARYALRTLVGEGRVRTVQDEGHARRYEAVREEGTDRAREVLEGLRQEGLVSEAVVGDRLDE